MAWLNHSPVTKFIVGVSLLVALLFMSSIGYYPPERSTIPIMFPLSVMKTPNRRKSIKILVANFEGPDPPNYPIAVHIRQAIQHFARDYYGDVEVELLGRQITRRDGPAAARSIGQAKQAAIVIWGWCAAPPDDGPPDDGPQAMQLNVNFELLHPSNFWSEIERAAQEQTRTEPTRTIGLVALEHLMLRVQVPCGKDRPNPAQFAITRCVIAQFAIGLSRYASADWDGTIAVLTAALTSIPTAANTIDPAITIDPVITIDPAMIYFYRANAYALKQEFDSAIADYNQALQLNPDDATTYNNRGVAYKAQGKTDQAIADFKRVLDLNPTPQVKSATQQRLWELGIQ